MSKIPNYLSAYDEFPIHQSSQTFGYIPSSDFSWDDGCYFGVFSPRHKVFLCTGYRVNPNSDMIGGFALLNVAGIQRTLRFSRCWRRDMRTTVGPFSVAVVEPLKQLRLKLAANDSGIGFDILWDGVSPAQLEEHHLAEQRGRRTTDQTRYCQPGKPTGVLSNGNQRWDVDPADWSCARDHSWGLYAERRPLSPDPKWLPPRIKPGGIQRALRFWIIFRSGDYSGFYHLHEDADGIQRDFSDVFGTALGGAIIKGWDESRHPIVAARHAAEYHPGTKILKRVVMSLEDSGGGKWTQEFIAAGMPWVGQTSGYYAGGWKDGGNVHTYHGSEELAMEWDEFDFSQQPLIHHPYATEGGALDGFGRGQQGPASKVQGHVYLCETRTTAPDGSVHVGAAHVEHYFNGPYRPYGFE